MRLMCVGYTWRGSNDGSLFRALSKSGHITDIIETDRFFPTSGNSLFLKVFDKILYRNRVNLFNKNIIDNAINNTPEVAIFYKAQEVFPETINFLKKIGVFTVNFYPDVSFFTHGDILSKSIYCYDLIVSTKSFAKKDLSLVDPNCKVEFLPHGFDKEIHRPITLSNTKISQVYHSDCVFIGQYSPSKANYLKQLISSDTTRDIKIWGNGWKKDNIDQKYIMGKSIFGDYYSVALQSSKIALGLLSEKVFGASSGDLITARTFEIPGTGAFMMHERTCEIHDYFDENKEIICFDTPEELIDKVHFYLKNEHLRNKIASKGRIRAWNDHTYEKRSEKLLEIINKNL